MASAGRIVCEKCLKYSSKVIFSPIFQINTKTTTGLFTLKPNFTLLVTGKSTMHKNIYSALNDEYTTKDFIYSLHPKERELLFTQMQKFEQLKLKTEGEGTAEPPTTEQLKILAFHNALPFIGFGFLDNLLMIVAGEYIDSTLGLTLGITTMAAAGLGNLISDVAGIGSATYVESLAMKFGVRTPELTPAQWDMGKTRWTSNLAKAFGVALGCFIGMFPLLLFRDGEKITNTRDKKS